MDQNWMQKIATALRGGAPAQQAGLQQAAQSLAGRAYQLHAAEAMANGQAPLSPQEFAMQQMQPAPQPAAQSQAEPAPFRF